ncbi:hypothetical protein DJ533_16800 [Acinetobacter defluvii]|uniref:Uncharacterized protein n=1 Tax=Acinetobacter defluvii TaxID=1871111 RepID=A0A2S2FGM8_9GAMM|nr:hypothetical protein [Acinetobacter defluvii]AWL30104.1 hypothetical protein DJ533_16800 [Acinetobacter defluvii]
MENIIQIEGFVENLEIQFSQLGLKLGKHKQQYVKSKKFTCTVNGHLLQGNFHQLMFGDGSNVRIVTYRFDDVSCRHQIDAILNLDNGILHIPAWVGYGTTPAIIDLVIFFPILIGLGTMIFFGTILYSTEFGWILTLGFATALFLVYFIGFIFTIPYILYLAKKDQELLADIGFSQPELALQRIFYLHNGKFRFEHSYGEVYFNGKYCHGIHDCKKLVDVYPDFKLSDIYQPQGSTTPDFYSVGI